MQSIIAVLILSATGYAQQPDSVTFIPLGLGVNQRADIATASTASISGDELRRSSAINLQDALYGKLLGLTALKQGGFEGDTGFGARFNIRGNQTSSETGILVLVDGFERPIDRVSLEEVESVTVLKDASAVALFGYKGINGALLVTTRRGSGERTTVHASYMHKFTFKPDIPKFVDGPTYAKALNEARTNDGLSPFYNKYELAAFENKSSPLVYPDVNWADEVLRNVGHENQVNFSVGGGFKAVKYYALFSYAGNKGLLKDTELDDYSSQLKSSKLNIRTNIDYALTKSTNVSISLMGSFFETNRPQGVGANDVFSRLYSIPSSAFPVETEDGLWGGNTTYGNKNVVANIQGSGYRKSNARTLFADIGVKQDLGMLLPGLSVSLRVGYDNFSEIYEDRRRGIEYGNDRYSYDDSGNIADIINYKAGDKTDNLVFSRWLNDQWRRTSFVASVDYANTFGVDHNLAVSFLYTADASSKVGRYNTFHRANWIGYFHYDKAGKYVADVTLAATGSNRAYPQKWDFSPVASLGWILSRENFLKHSQVVDYLKIRASAGILHTDYVPLNGLAFEDYSAGAGDYYFGQGYSQVWGFYMGYTPTKSFRHETANKFNLGVDAGLFKSLALTAELYYQRRCNILQSSDGVNSSVFGLPASYVNKGVVDTKGVEIGLRYDKSFGDFRLALGGMVTYGTSEVVDAVETPQAFGYLSKIGKMQGQRFGLEAIGLFQDQADIKNSLPQEFDALRPGDIKYKDQNGDKVINHNDMVAMKYSDGLPEINYAFNIGLEYKGLGFDAYFQGVGNYWKYTNTVGLFTPITDVNANLSQHYLDNCWRPGQDNAQAKYPRLSSRNSPNNYRESTLWYQNAAFLKLRHCELYYNFPERMVKKLRLKNVRAFVRGENLFSIDSYQGIDPEVDWAAYPTLTSVALGLSVTF